LKISGAGIMTLTTGAAALPTILRTVSSLNEFIQKCKDLFNNSVRTMNDHFGTENDTVVVEDVTEEALPASAPVPQVVVQEQPPAPEPVPQVVVEVQPVTPAVQPTPAEAK
jgi:hypothetical protein